MVERSRSVLLDRTYGALAQPVRRDLLETLREGPRSITDLAAPFDISFAAVSKHLGILDEAGLVSRTRSGRNRIVSLEPLPLVPAGEWIDSYRVFWEQRLDALEDHLAARGRR